MKRIFKGIAMLVLLLSMSLSAFALTQSEAIEAYKNELVALGLEEEAAAAKASADVNALIASMTGSQTELGFNFSAMEERVDNVPKSDLRRDQALDALDYAEEQMDNFKDLDPSTYIFLQESIAGAPPRVTEDTSFKLAREQAEGAIASVNRILIAPARPGAVPEGDIVSDFIPQIIRQLFRFAWLAVLIAFTVSGVMFIIARDNEERITKAKAMITFSFIGFAFIALAFAIVKAVTDIDFFRFI